MKKKGFDTFEAYHFLRTGWVVSMTPIFLMRQLLATGEYPYSILAEAHMKHGNGLARDGFLIWDFLYGKAPGWGWA